MGNIIFNFNSGRDDIKASLDCKNLRKESERLKTFDAWKHVHPKPKDLAQSGFYYTGYSDMVLCAFCGVEIGMWENDDDVMKEHLKWSPSCRLISRRETSNVPVNAKELDKKLPPKSWDETGVGHEKHTGIEEPVTACTIELLEHERMRKYLIKYGYRIVKIETDG